MEVDDERQVVARPLREARSHDAGVPHVDRPTHKRLVERPDRQPGRKRAKPPRRRGHLREAIRREGRGGERVAPVVEVAHDHRGMRVGRAKEHVAEQPSHLPLPLLLGEPEVRVHEMQPALRRIDHEQLRAPRLSRVVAQADPMPARDRPPRKHEIAVGAIPHRHVRLEDRMAAEVAGEQPRLVVEAAAANVAIDLLQADEIGILRLDAVDDPRERIAAVAAADPLVDIPAEEPHGEPPSSDRRRR